jgi:hypothetical protein
MPLLPDFSKTPGSGADMTDLTSQPQTGVRRGWLILATVGCALVVLTLVVVGLVLVDKKHFGSMVGPMFLPIITGGIFVGALLVLIATSLLPIRRTWRGIVLFAWALVALTSPLFGIMFLLPWGVLVLALPLVLWILFGLWRGPMTT